MREATRCGRHVRSLCGPHTRPAGCCCCCLHRALCLCCGCAHVLGAAALLHGCMRCGGMANPLQCSRLLLHGCCACMPCYTSHACWRLLLLHRRYALSVAAMAALLQLPRIVMAAAAPAAWTQSVRCGCMGKPVCSLFDRLPPPLRSPQRRSAVPPGDARHGDEQRELDVIKAPAFLPHPMPVARHKRFRSGTGRERGRDDDQPNCWLKRRSIFVLRRSMTW